MQLRKMAYIITAFLLFFTLANAARTKPAGSVDGVCNLVIRPFHCKEYRVTTTDGYMLGLQRIYRRNSANKIPVLLQHGILSDATTWLANSRNESLGFILADNNYDVWLGNVRGTKSSRGHTNLSFTYDAKKYWNWSWDELAAHDLPAFVKHIHQQTGQKTHYVGHSLGTLMALVAFSQHEVVSMVRSDALLSPIAYMDQIPSKLVRRLALILGHQPVYLTGLHKFSVGGGSVRASQTRSNVTLVCDQLEKVAELLDKVIRVCKHMKIKYCNNPVHLITGPNCCLNKSKPFQAQAPTSIKNMIHLAQMIRHGTIQKYNYGSRRRNLKHYRQNTPPAYNMTNIPKNLPLMLAYGGKDMLSDVEDVQTLIKALAHHKLKPLLVKNYAHLDFVGGINAKEVVYDRLMEFFNHN